MQKILKLFSKNKKILLTIGLALFLTLILSQSVKAQGCSPSEGICGTCTRIECVPPCVWNETGGRCIGTGAGTVSQQAPWCIIQSPWDPLICIFQYFLSLPIRIVFFAVGAMAIVIAIATSFFALISNPVASWMIGLSLNPDLIKPDAIMDIFNNTIRPFANTFLGLFLALIGLATILKLREYEARKALAPLIIVALLINFIPTLVDMVVSFGNQLTKAFLYLGGVGGQIQLINPIDILAKHTNTILGLAGTTFNADGNFFQALFWSIPYNGGTKGPLIIEITGFALLSIVLAFFSLAVTLINFLFGLIFLLRIIFIWLLLIVAPIAFITFIFRTTEMKAIFPGFLNWDEWWPTLLQWAFMGIPLAIWLLIANLLIMGVAGGGQGINLGKIELTTASVQIFGEAAGASNAILNTTANLLVDMLPFVGALAALYLGVTTAPGMMGDAAKKAFSWAQSTLTTTGAAAVGAAAGYMAGAARGLPQVSRAEESIRKRLEATPFVGRMFGGPGAFEAEKSARLGKSKEEITKIPDNYEGNVAIKQIALTELNRYRKAAAIETLARRKSLDFTPDEAQKFIPDAQKFGADISAIYKARPDFAQYLTTIDPATKKSRAMTIEEVMGKIEPGDFWRNIQKDALRNDEVVFQAAMDERKFNQMGRNLKPELKREFKNTFFSAPPRTLTPQQQKIIERRINELSTRPEWEGSMVAAPRARRTPGEYPPYVV